MKRTCSLLLFIITCVGTLSLSAQENQKPTISVNATGKASAKPDVAIISMTVRSTAPLAADALDQNNKRVADIRARLIALGYKDKQVKFSGSHFGPSRGGQYYGGGQLPPGFDVFNNFYVYIEGPELNDVTQFTKRVSALLDELNKLGATIGNVSNVGNSMGVLTFSIKDPAPYEKQATAEGLDKARPLADEIARRMKVQITGIVWASAYPTGRTSMGMPASALDEVPYEYFSSSMEEVPVRVRVDVRYTYK
jgi:uncharacterized protein YggE